MRDRSRQLLKIARILPALLLLSSIAMSHPHRWRSWRPYRSPYHSWIAVAGWPLTTGDAARLRPGGYLWRGAVGYGAVSILIDLGRQMAYVYQGDTLVGISTISSGRRGYETPTGVFPILEKAVWHRSNRYSSAPMPYMQRLTWGGVALHAGGVPGYRQSHGCIHLPGAFARALFGITTLGAQVAVTHEAPIGPVLTHIASFPTTANSFALITAVAL